jgi:hypothetical protein
MADHDLSGGKVSAITSIRYRPDVPGGNSNIAVVAQVGWGDGAGSQGHALSWLHLHRLCQGLNTARLHAVTWD